MSPTSCLNAVWTPALVSGRRVRGQTRFTRAAGTPKASETGDARPAQLGGPVVIKTPLPSRTPATPPQPAPIEHSTAYLLRTNKHNEASTEELALAGRSAAGDEPFEGNAVEWVLRKVDESLDQVEENPPAYAKAIYDISTGPVGEAAAKGAAAAARISVEVGTQALKAAAPVGKWVLREGFKAAAGAVGSGLSSALNSKRGSGTGSGGSGSPPKNK